MFDRYRYKLQEFEILRETTEDSKESFGMLSDEQIEYAFFRCVSRNEDGISFRQQTINHEKEQIVHLTMKFTKEFFEKQMLLRDLQEI